MRESKEIVVLTESFKTVWKSEKWGSETFEWQIGDKCEVIKKVNLNFLLLNIRLGEACVISDSLFKAE